MSVHEKELKENFVKSAIAYGEEEGASRKFSAGIATQIYKRNCPMLGEMTSEAEAQRALMTIFRDAFGKLMRGRRDLEAPEDGGDEA